MESLLVLFVVIAVSIYYGVRFLFSKTQLKRLESIEKIFWNPSY